MSPAAKRKVAIAVDLSDESAYAVRWAVSNYLRPDDSVIVLHVEPTNVLYGADWGAIDQSIETISEETEQQFDSSFDILTSNRAADLAKPILDAEIPVRVHVVKDHDMKERICLEVDRLGANVVIMGSRGFRAVKKACKSGLGNVSDYCVDHCDCRVVVVRYPEEMEADGGARMENVMTEVKEATEDHHDTPSKSVQHLQYSNGIIMATL